MALGKQLSPVQTLVTFCLWAQRNGYHVGEMHGFAKVHNVHTKGSWHYDREGKWGKAADINKNGPNEYRDLSRAVDVAQELGLAVIFARDGTHGPTANHRTHLHVDVGPYSNLGRGPFTPRGGGDLVTKALQKAVRATQDMIWGPDTEKRLEAVRASSLYRGSKFPHGVKYTQGVIGTTRDGKWGPKSARAHDKTVTAIQKAIGVRADGVWGPVTEREYARVRAIRRR